MKEVDVPEDFVASYEESEDATSNRIYITVDITNEYVQAAAETGDNTTLLIVAGAMMLIMMCYLAIKIRKTPTK